MLNNIFKNIWVNSTQSQEDLAIPTHSTEQLQSSIWRFLDIPRKIWQILTFKIEGYNLLDTKIINWKTYHIVLEKWMESNTNIDLIIDWEKISFPLEWKIINKIITIESCHKGMTQITKTDWTEISSSSWDYVFLRNWRKKELKNLWIKIEREYKQVERIWDLTIVELSKENTAKVKRYGDEFRQSYWALWRETDLFRVWINIDAVWITTEKWWINWLLWIMLSKKWIASEYSWALTDWWDGWWLRKDTFAWLHWPYFVVKNWWNKENYNYLFPNSEWIDILSDCLDELILIWEITPVEKNDILKMSFTYEDFVEIHQNSIL